MDEIRIVVESRDGTVLDTGLRSIPDSLEENPDKEHYIMPNC